MKCPKCGNTEDKVLEARNINDGLTTRRRRQCLACGLRFTSYEKIEYQPLTVLKRNHKKEKFDAKKLEAGLNHALRKRLVSQRVIKKLADKIENEVRSLAIEDEVSSSTIGDIIMKELFTLDKVAYVRFVSVYKHFDDTQEFIEIISQL